MRVVAFVGGPPRGSRPTYLRRGGPRRAALQVGLMGFTVSGRSVGPGSGRAPADRSANPHLPQWFESATDEGCTIAFTNPAGRLE